ncbi:hypothetical protein ACJX0J_032934, partial [Zea mays]
IFHEFIFLLLCCDLLEDEETSHIIESIETKQQHCAIITIKYDTKKERMN